MLVEIKAWYNKETAVVRSSEIAKAFEVPHEEVMQDIENLDCAENLKCELFQRKTSIDGSMEYYETTDSGILFLALVYTQYSDKDILVECLSQIYAIKKFLRQCKTH